MLKKVQFKAKETHIMKVIEENGEFQWDMVNPKEYESALKDLVFHKLIKHKPTYGNVFIPTELGAKAIEWNKMIDMINS